MAIESVMPSNHLILCHPLLLPSISPSIGVFSNESVLHIRWPKRFSFSSGLISFRGNLISLQSKGLSRGFSNTTVQKHQFFGAQLSLWKHTQIYIFLGDIYRSIFSLKLSPIFGYHAVSIHLVTFRFISEVSMGRALP